MATVKAKVRPSCIEGNPGTLYYQVIHQRVVRQITTDIHLFPHQLDREGCVVSDVNDSEILRNRIDSDMALLHRIVRDLETEKQLTGRDFSATDITARFHAPEHGVSVLGFMQEQIRFLSECNRLGTAKNYCSALDCLRGFLEGRDLTFPQMTPHLVEQYNEYLQRKGLARNSLSFHMRILRAVYNKSVRKGLVEQSNPFRNVYTGVDRTRKRAVGKHIISRLTALDLSGSAPLSFARDLFLFSLYTRGMAFVDMAFLKRDNIKDGIISYCRRKTKQELCIRIEPCMQQIMDRYGCRSGSYVFPIVRSEDSAEAYTQYLTGMAYNNRLLKRLSKLLGLQQSLSFYTARHSWATMARDCHVPVSVISAGMGHTSERTTRIYLTTLENSLIDNANRGILSKLRNVYSL